MMEYKKVIIGLGFFFIAQTLSWVQNNSQFLSQWAKDNPIILAGLMGIPVGVSYIYGTANLVEAFNGKLWPPRLLGFATGIFSFTFLTYIFFKEGINLKTGITLFLASIIVLMQIFWKYE